MTVDTDWWQPTIVRRGEEIVVAYGKNRFVHCNPVATIHNTDTVVMTDESTIDLRGGPFSPGASAETDGSPEIEFEIGPSIEYPVDLMLGDGDDHITAGVLGDSAIGVNLNPSEADTDADVTLTPDDPESLGFANLQIHAGAGDDVIDANGGNGFARRSRYGVGFIFGDGGSDTILGTDSYDWIAGGGGSDTIDARGKADSINTRDGSSDRVICGRGRDSLLRDRLDKGATGCESNLLPNQDLPLPDPPHIPHLRP